MSVDSNVQCLDRSHSLKSSNPQTVRTVLKATVGNEETFKNSSNNLKDEASLQKTTHTPFSNCTCRQIGENESYTTCLYSFPTEENSNSEKQEKDESSHST